MEELVTSRGHAWKLTYTSCLSSHLEQASDQIDQPDRRQLQSKVSLQISQAGGCIQDAEITTPQIRSDVLKWTDR